MPQICISLEHPHGSGVVYERGLNFPDDRKMRFGETFHLSSLRYGVFQFVFVEKDLALKDEPDAKHYGSDTVAIRGGSFTPLEVAPFGNVLHDLGFRDRSHALYEPMRTGD